MSSYIDTLYSIHRKIFDDFNNLNVLINKKKLNPDEIIKRNKLYKEILDKLTYVPLDLVDINDKTPLIYAVEYNLDNIAIDILKNENCTNDIINMRDVYGKNAFIYAVENDSTEICKEIVNKLKYNLVKTISKQLNKIIQEKTSDELSSLIINMNIDEDLSMSGLISSFDKLKVGLKQENELELLLKNLIDGISWPKELLDDITLDIHKNFSGKTLTFTQKENIKLIEKPPKGEVILKQKIIKKAIPKPIISERITMFKPMVMDTSKKTFISEQREKSKKRSDIIKKKLSSSRGLDSGKYKKKSFRNKQTKKKSKSCKKSRKKGSVRNRKTKKCRKSKSRRK